MKKLVAAAVFLSLFSYSLLCSEFAGSRELRKVTVKVARAADKFSDAIETLFSKYNRVMSNEQLRWDGKDKKSKRSALTSILKQYKDELGAFNVMVDKQIADKKTKPDTRDYIASELDAAFSMIKNSHDSLVTRLKKSKAQFAQDSRKELNQLIWSIGGASDQLVEVSAMQTEGRKKFMDAFIKNIETFFSLYMRRMQSAVKSFRKKLSKCRQVLKRLN